MLYILAILAWTKKEKWETKNKTERRCIYSYERMWCTNGDWVSKDIYHKMTAYLHIMESV
jgi:hypothetical protein